MKNLSRKDFLSLAMNGALFAPVFMKAGSAIRNHENESQEIRQSIEPRFRFLQISDLHVQSPESVSGPTYRNANERADWLLEAINSNNFFEPLDFVIATGDMIHGENIGAIKKDLEFFRKQFLSKLSVPLHPVAGNHEIIQQEGDPVYEAPYNEIFGEGKLNYSFVHKGIHFIIINNSGSWSVNDKKIIDRRQEVFAGMLGREPGMPKIICCHIPLHPIREKKVLAESFGFASYFTKESELAGLVDDKRHNVLAVISGHLHLTGMTRIGQVCHISVSGLASYPHDMAVYSVYDDRIDVEMIRVPSNLLEPSTNIHGAARFGHDFTDNLHHDYTSYLMGNREERSFSIAINRK